MCLNDLLKRLNGLLFFFNIHIFQGAVPIHQDLVSYKATVDLCCPLKLSVRMEMFCIFIVKYNNYKLYVAI